MSSESGSGAPETRLRLYKFMRDVDVPVYSPAAPNPYSVGRFGAGGWPTLYLAESSAAAMAEFFRINPSLLSVQGGVKVTVFEIEIEVWGRLVDVRSTADAFAAGIDPAELVSSDPEPAKRWKACQEFAAAARADGAVGIVYPSAASAGSWNLVLFDEPDVSTWTVVDVAEVGRPTIDPAVVCFLTGS
ncbi:hypothetical protein Back2_18250 [Nocardioides baekrokdamisoli]|uniref:RES domain-containing protein n=1 Tax=Nocardioides baekrokdamisoli TaxID=1804624 RepID=A0A3G9J1V4_9ACTN|nr:RES family NAD+ phosphorylase [Nocardioides baekrokdamisoli]BBH17538.1 hypothetical protein Back2_18250 [Nocardioides baekrokdamisoli]